MIVVSSVIHCAVIASIAIKLSSLKIHFLIDRLEYISSLFLYLNIKIKDGDSMSDITYLHKAKNNKNDEFYTQLKDIENELKHYECYFKDKIIYCNCDNPKWSNFWKYFEMNFRRLDLKKLIATYYEKDTQSYKLELIKNKNDIELIKTPLIGDGDFRSQ